MEGEETWPDLGSFSALLPESCVMLGSQHADCAAGRTHHGTNHRAPLDSQETSPWEPGLSFHQARRGQEQSMGTWRFLR